MMISPHTTPIVLMIHQSADMYGSDKVLLLIVREFLASGSFLPIVLLPTSGPLKTCLDAMGVETHVGEVGKIQRADLSFSGLLALPKRLIKARQDLKKAAAGRPIAVLHSNTLAVLGGAWCSKTLGWPHVWHVHEILRSPRLISRLLPWLASRRADAVVCNSTQTQAWIVSHQPAMLERTHVVFNGLPPMPDLPSIEGRCEFRERIGATPDDIVISLVGRISRIKGQDVLIEAAHLLKCRGVIEGMKLVIMGSEAPRQETLLASLKQRVEQLGLSPYVRFLPFDANVVPVWSGSDIAVMPSVEPESFGMVAIEAMAAGLPVIASDDGGLRDVVVNEETGILIPVSSSQALADGIERLAQDPGLRHRWGQAGKARQLSVFSASHQAREIMAVYRLAMRRRSAL